MCVADDIVLTECHRIVVVDSYIGKSILFLKVVADRSAHAFALKDVPALLSQYSMKVSLERLFMPHDIGLNPDCLSVEILELIASKVWLIQLIVILEHHHFFFFPSH